ncbi:peptidoglycan-binding domain-containing protein [Streptomyces sp. cmx-4-7]|uniref:peptidoglycan-binding domain-containing protein n=1 Tax=Streptomyces sp. cmx-4-7 TaxID=2790939 RepID=UPI00397F94AC
MTEPEGTGADGPATVPVPTVELVPAAVTVPALVSAPAPVSGLARRRRWVAAVAVGAVVLSGVGIGAARLIKSPAQAAAEAGPPPMDLLVARVEKRVLRDTVIVRGTATAAQTVQVAPVTSVEGAGSPVVTKLPVAVGDRVTAGRVLLEVSGRPVFVLPGRLPVYRDLKPGATGEDVEQLQKALARRGHGTGADRAGTFGAGTKAALTAFYSSIGYDPLPAVADGGESVAAAEDAVTSAERALEDAVAARDAAKEAPAGGEGEDGAGAGSGGAGKGSSGTDGGKASAGGGGSGGGADAERAVRRAREDLAEARTDLAGARAVTGPMLPAGEVVFLEGFPARVDSVPARTGSPVSGPVMSLSAGALVVRALLQEHQKGLVRAGQKVEVLSEVSGVSAPARVQSVAGTMSQAQTPGRSDGSGGDQGGQEAGGERGYAMTVRPEKPLNPELAGQDVRLTIEAAATGGDALVVPVSAVSAGADGRTTVTVVEGTTRRQVEVRPGTTGDGFVEIEPVGPGRVEEGDNVITGINPGLAGGTDKADKADPGGADGTDTGGTTP